MRKPLLTLYFFCIASLLRAQTPDSLIFELKAINSKVAGEGSMPGTGSRGSATGAGDLISNRAMNIFLSNKAGSFLSESDNLSLYKNSVNFNSAEGVLALNHNLYTVKGIDDRVRSLPTIGVRANVTDAFASTFTGRPFNNQFGFYFKQTWIGKSKTVRTDGQKKAMDAWRAGILHSLEMEIRKKAADLELALNAMDSLHELPGQDLATAKSMARQKYYADWQDEYEYEFARQQSETLAKAFMYQCISVHWTSISLYLPLIRERFETAPSLADSVVVRHAYPLHFNISHTRLWESSKYGRFFATLSGELFWNNSRDAIRLPSDEIYTGNYENYFTPLVKGQFIYIPRNSHVGVSFLLEQNFGAYHALNGRLGVPIVLINKKAEPAINFEFQVRYFDMGNSLSPAKGLPDKTSIAVSVGIPFSRIAY
jgi:hypothetical protein